MAKYHGKSGVITFGAGPTAIAEVTAWDYDENVELAEDHGMGAAAKSYKAGIPDGGGSLTCRHSPAPTPDAGQALLDVGTVAALNLYPVGNTSGNVKYTGTVVITDVKRSADLSKVGELSVTYKGMLAEGTVT